MSGWIYCRGIEIATAQLEIRRGGFDDAIEGWFANQHEHCASRCPDPTSESDDV